MAADAHMSFVGVSPQQTYFREVQEEFANLPADAREAYKNCMRTEAVYKSALPMGLVMGGGCYTICRVAGLGTIGKIGSALMGLIGYGTGRIIYSTQCLEKHAPSVVKVMQSIYTRKHLDHNLQQESLIESSGLPKEEESNWSSYDTFSSDADSDLSSTSTDFQEEESTARTPSKNVKKYVTYDDLRRRSRGEYYNSYRREPTPQSKPKRDAEILDDSFLNTDTYKESTWG